jgi:hypothetical protein
MFQQYLDKAKRKRKKLLFCARASQLILLSSFSAEHH